MKMGGNVRSVRGKERKLLQLYSLWHETHQGAVQRKCMSLLGEIMRADPGFSLRGEFRTAF